VLLAEGALVDASDQRGATPLMVAAGDAHAHATAIA
jgi:hypothetical protein